MSVDCNLCDATGMNRSGYTMRMNNELCPRCGGYGYVPDSTDNPTTVTEQDLSYVGCNNGDTAALRSALNKVFDSMAEAQK